MRHLDAKGASWRWYAHDVATLRLIDDRYRIGHYAHFFFFEKGPPSSDWLTSKPKTFLDHVASGDLAAVSWVDPDFTSWGSPTLSNDDHPPSDVSAGQELVLKLYNAVINSPVWEKILSSSPMTSTGVFTTMCRHQQPRMTIPRSVATVFACQRSSSHPG